MGKRGWLASTARHDRALSSGHSLSDRATLADALRRLNRAQIPLDGASDHGVSEALYLRDPDENGVELYRDRPRDQWPRSATGEITMYSRQLDLDALLAEK